MQSTVTPTLKHYLTEHILPLYRQFDKAHGTAHVAEVIEKSLSLATQYPMNLDMIYTVAAFHDIGLLDGREDHHLSSAKALLCDRFVVDFFSAEQLTVMAEAIEDHRASSPHEPRSIYGKIVSAADRTINCDQVILRTIQYSLSHAPTLSDDKRFYEVCQHLEEKYGVNGYIKFWLEVDQNLRELTRLQTLLENKETFRHYYNRLLEDML